jgi:hypothetical protein
LRRAVIALEANHFGVRKVARKTEKDGNVSAAPAVDGLVFVANHADVLVRADEQAKQIVLDAVGVLIFVDVNVLKAVSPFFADLRRFAKQTRGAEQEIVEVERFALREDFFVLCENVGGMAHVGRVGFGTQHFRSLGVIFGEADLAEDGAGLQLFVFEIEATHGKFDGGELVGVVEDRKIRGQAGGRGFAPKQARAQRMKRGEPRAFGWNTGFQQKVGDARLHFLGCFVGEGDREDGFGGDTARNEIGHAEGDGASFAGTGAGEQKHRTFGGFCGETLFRIERVEKVLHGSVEESDSTMLTDGDRRRKFVKIC